MSFFYLATGLIVLGRTISGISNHVERKLSEKQPHLARWELSTQEDMKMLHARQDPARPPYTDYPVCDDEDGFFFVKDIENLTFQVQCTTIYVGTQDNYSPADDLFGCVDFCAALNSASRGSCLGVNWNAPFVGSGDCNTFSSIRDALPAFEGGGYQEAALLILGSDGTVFAKPRPFNAPSSTSTTDIPTSTTGSSSSTTSLAPPFSSLSTTTPGASSPFSTTTPLGGTVVPDASSSGSVNPTNGASTPGSTPTTSAEATSSGSSNRTNGGSTPDSTLATFVFPSSSPSTCSTRTTTVTSRTTLIACPPGVSCGTPIPRPASSTPSTASPSIVIPPPEVTTTTSNLVSSTTPFTTSFPPPITGPNGQVTAFEPIPVTIFEVQPLLICDTAARCSPSARTETLVTLRTGLRCSPGVCSGDMVNTLVDALFAAPTCVLLP